MSTSIRPELGTARYSGVHRAGTEVNFRSGLTTEKTGGQSVDGRRSTSKGHTVSGGVKFYRTKDWTSNRMDKNVSVRGVPTLPRTGSLTITTDDRLFPNIYL